MPKQFKGTPTHQPARTSTFSGPPGTSARDVAQPKIFHLHSFSLQLQNFGLHRHIQQTQHNTAVLGNLNSCSATHQKTVLPSTKPKCLSQSPQAATMKPYP